ncbi:MAG: hypothetical protein HKN92_08670 [Chitinophagales bacterium]|nr:hypothetical protein [Chitinophagales bacterium]
MQTQQLTAVLTTLFLLWSVSLFAEGTKETTPTSTDVADLNFWRGNTQTNGVYDGDSLGRINIYIEDPSKEVIYVGFNEAYTGNIFFRIKSPSGTILGGSATMIPAAGAGFIATHAEAIAGPSQVVGAAGYLGLKFSPTETGVHYIEFNADNASTQTTTAFDIQWYDMTVVDSTTSTIIPGRLYSSHWAFNCQSFANPFRGAFYTYTPDSVVTELDLNSFRPFIFTIYCNGFGSTNTGNYVVDRRSKNATSNTLPQYPLFLNDPDSTIWPTATLTGEIDTSVTPTIEGCPGNYCINVRFKKGGFSEFYLDLNGVTGFQSGTEDVFITETVPGGDNCIFWDGLDGLGAPVSDGVDISVTAIIQSGLNHFPTYDSEFNDNGGTGVNDGFIVNLIRPTAAQPRLYYDDSEIPDAPGNGNAKVNLTGCLPPCHDWTNTNYGDQNIINTWWFGFTDSTNFIAEKIAPPCGCNLDAILGNVFIDENMDGINDSTEAGSSGVLVNLYHDINGDSILDITDTIVDTTYTNASGDYVFSNVTALPLPVNYIMTITKSTLPISGILTTQNLQAARFVTTGTTNCNNDFGVIGKPLANPDSAAIGKGFSVSIDVLVNDIDFNNNLDPGTVTINGVMQPSLGSVTAIDPITGVIDYLAGSTPGNDVFEYIICDSTGLCDTGSVYVQVLTEQCSNKIDDDGDGLIDCKDPDCGVPAADTIYNNNALICERATGLTFSTDSVPGATSYIWSVPSGSKIISGKGTRTITVNWGLIPGDVCVTVKTGVCYSIRRCRQISITKKSRVPGSILRNN